MGPRVISVGLDVGQRHDPTAICVFEALRETGEVLPPVEVQIDGLTTLVTDRTPRSHRWLTYSCRHLGRLPLDTPYPVVAKYVAGVVVRLYLREHKAPTIFVDQTGHIAFVEMLRAELARIPHRLVPVTLGSGDGWARRFRGGYEEWGVGKTWLVSRMQALLQTQRMQIPEHHPEAKALFDELQAFEIQAAREAGGHDESGARSGKHDDLVIAAGLGTLLEEQSVVGVIDPDEMVAGGGRWSAWR